MSEETIDKILEKSPCDSDKSLQNLDDLNKMMAKLGLNHCFGKLPEYLIADHLFQRFNELGYDFNRIGTGGLTIHENGQVVAEVNITLQNRKTIFLINVYEDINKRDIEKHLERIKIVRRSYEQSRNSVEEFIGVVAGAVFPNDAKQFAIENGFYVVIPSGDTLKINVPENFKPKIF